MCGLTSSMSSPEPRSVARSFGRSAGDSVPESLARLVWSVRLCRPLCLSHGRPPAAGEPRWSEGGGGEVVPRHPRTTTAARRHRRCRRGTPVWRPVWSQVLPTGHGERSPAAPARSGPGLGSSYRGKIQRRHVQWTTPAQTTQQRGCGYIGRSAGRQGSVETHQPALHLSQNSTDQQPDQLTSTQPRPARTDGHHIQHSNVHWNSSHHPVFWTDLTTWRWRKGVNSF